MNITNERPHSYFPLKNIFVPTAITKMANRLQNYNHVSKKRKVFKEINILDW